jgi:hypothetical protein
MSHNDMAPTPDAAAAHYCVPPVEFYKSRHTLYDNLDCRYSATTALPRLKFDNDFCQTHLIPLNFLIFVAIAIHRKNIEYLSTAMWQ